MPLAILGVLSAFFSLTKVLVEKFVPDRTTRKSKPYRLHGKAVKRIEAMRNFCKKNPTMEEIADKGKNEH